jgi:hypothetical protein
MTQFSIHNRLSAAVSASPSFISAGLLEPRMELMSDDTEKAIRLLTKVAGGDVALVRQVLIEHKGADAKTIVEFIRKELSNRSLSSAVSH